MAKLEKDVPLRILLKDVPLKILVLIAVVFGPSIIVDYLHIETFKGELIVRLLVPLVLIITIVVAYLVINKLSKRWMLSLGSTPIIETLVNVCMRSKASETELGSQSKTGFQNDTEKQYSLSSTFFSPSEARAFPK